MSECSLSSASIVHRISRTARMAADYLSSYYHIVVSARQDCNMKSDSSPFHLPFEHGEQVNGFRPISLYIKTA